MDELPLSDLQARAVELVLETPAPGRQAARSAIRHIQRAWQIQNLDPEMAVFRAITGEEEAARALFHALQRRGYDGANRLNWHKHEHKAAVIPFFQALNRATKELIGLDAELTLDVKLQPARFGLRFAATLPNGEKRWLSPIPPLNYSLEYNGVIHNFSEEFSALATESGVESIQMYVSARSNERNRLLYATNDGIPNVIQPVHEHLQFRRDAIFLILIAYLMIDPYPENQLFVQQSLDVFLSIVPRLRV